jgi:hypothetical protein
VIESVNVVPLAGLGLTETEDLLAHKNIDRRYARRILYWIYKKGIGAFSEINDIPKNVLSVLSDSFCTGLSKPVSRVVSADGTPLITICFMNLYIFLTVSVKQYVFLFSQDAVWAVPSVQQDRTDGEVISQPGRLSTRLSACLKRLRMSY